MVTGNWDSLLSNPLRVFDYLPRMYRLSLLSRDAVFCGGWYEPFDNGGPDLSLYNESGELRSELRYIPSVLDAILGEDGSSRGSDSGKAISEESAFCIAKSTIGNLLQHVVEKPSDVYMAALFFCVLRKYPPFIAAPCRDGMTPLTIAIKYKCYPLLIGLIEEGADVNASGNDSDFTPLSLACRLGEVSITETLLQYGANPNYRDNVSCSAFPLNAAIECGSTKLVKLLLDAGADPNACGYSDDSPPLWHAIGKQNGEMIFLLIQAGADVDWEPDKDEPFTLPLLHQAAWYRDAEAIICLLANGNLANARSNCASGGATPLHFLVRERYSRQSFDALVNSGADVHIRDSEGRAVIHYLLSYHGGSDMIWLPLLIRNGADINAMDREGRNVLHYFAIGSYGIHGEPDTSLKDRSYDNPEEPVFIREDMMIDDTPSQISRMKDFSMCRWVRMLLRYGADAGVKDIYGNPPAEYALESQYFNTANLLRRVTDQPEETMLIGYRREGC